MALLERIDRLEQSFDTWFDRIEAAIQLNSMAIGRLEQRFERFDRESRARVAGLEATRQREEIDGHGCHHAYGD